MTYKPDNLETEKTAQQIKQCLQKIARGVREVDYICLDERHVRYCAEMALFLSQGSMMIDSPRRALKHISTGGELWFLSYRRIVEHMKPRGGRVAVMIDHTIERNDFKFIGPVKKDGSHKAIYAYHRNVMERISRQPDKVAFRYDFQAFDVKRTKAFTYPIPKEKGKVKINGL